MTSQTIRLASAALAAALAAPARVTVAKKRNGFPD